MPNDRPGQEPYEEIGAGEPAVRVHVRTARPSPAVPASVALVLVFLAVAIVKPWGGIASSGSPVASASAAAADASGGPEAAVPTPVLDRGLAVAAECHAPSGWRIVTNEHWQGREVRIWWAIEPVRSTSAFDPSIPYLSVVSDAILQLGYCAPLFEPEKPASSEAVGIWRIDPVASTAEAIHPTRIAPAFDDAAAAIWAPPGSATAGTASWPTGRYVIGVGGRWFGVDLRIIDRTQTPAPAASSSASVSPSAPPDPSGPVATPTSAPSAAP